MAITPNPDFTPTWITPPGPGLARKFIAALQAVLDSGVLGAGVREIVQMLGRPSKAAGSVAEVAADLSRLDEATLVNATANLRGTPQQLPAGQARRTLTLSLDFRTGTVVAGCPGWEPDRAEQTTDLIKSHLPEAPSVVPAQPPLSRRSAVPTNRRGLVAGARVDAYELKRRIGSGFSSEVWEAVVVEALPSVELDQGQRVALKCYLPHVLRERIESLRIQREFQLASDIRHPNIVRVHDLVLSPSRGYSFIAMDLVEGDVLRSRIPTLGLPVGEICAIGEQIFQALNEIHVRRALHRDIKPANIMLTSARGEKPLIVVLDLGIVSLASDPSLTNTSTFLGSKHSAPFEQLTGQFTDERSDIYAAAATLFHCYTGLPMYFRDGPEGGIVARMLRDPQMLAARPNSTEADHQLVDFLNGCLAVEASARPSGASTCADTLREIAERLGG